MIQVSAKMKQLRLWWFFFVYTTILYTNTSRFERCWFFAALQKSQQSAQAPFLCPPLSVPLTGEQNRGAMVSWWSSDLPKWIKKGYQPGTNGMHPNMNPFLLGFMMIYGHSKKSAYENIWGEPERLRVVPRLWTSLSRLRNWPWAIQKPRCQIENLI